MAHPSRCYCLKRGCRRGRRLCRATDNPRNATCNCASMHYPHRIGSGTCQYHPNGLERMNSLAYGPDPDAAENAWNDRNNGGMF